MIISLAKLVIKRKHREYDSAAVSWFSKGFQASALLSTKRLHVKVCYSHQIGQSTKPMKQNQLFGKYNCTSNQFGKKIPAMFFKFCLCHWFAIKLEVYLNQLICLKIYCSCSFIKNEYFGFPENGSSQANELSLANRKISSSFIDPMIKSIRP